MGADMDHATLNRRAVKYAPLISVEVHKRKQKTAGSWRMDETCINCQRRTKSAPVAGAIQRYFAGLAGVKQRHFI